MFSQTQLQGVEGEQLDLYMDWLLQEISRCEAEADNCSREVRNEVFHKIKQRTLHQELRRHRRELRRVLDEKKRRLHWWCH
ncbi:hypothetical protein LZU96_23445 (plasmid) [Pantoea agglomerans]|uniref:hypothetical protein n=1 Tax=Enterobacter agglomerans TaxID=549 RepID=UPI001F419F68|nr:hypothetical protein [Pantoea agglomerans]UIL55115.1 hypothetical protein LZU96_23445 [Pantoea agglomerans]